MVDYTVNVVELATLSIGLFGSFLFHFRKFVKIEFQLEQLVEKQSELIDGLDRLNKVEVEIADRSARIELLEKKFFNGGYKYERSS